MAPPLPYRQIEHCNSLTAQCGQDQLVSVDKESHINVRVNGESSVRSDACERPSSNALLCGTLLTTEFIPHFGIR